MIRATFLRKLLLPAIELWTEARFWSEYRAAARLDFAPESPLQQLRERRLAAILTTACATQLHRERLVTAGLPESAAQLTPGQAFDVLKRLAPIAKPELRRNFPEGVTTPVGSADRTYISTSGTTERLTVVADFNKRDARRSAGFHALKIALDADVGVRCVEIPPNACNVVCGLEDGQSPPSLIEHCWSAFRRGQLFSRESRAEIHGWVERRLLQHRQTLRPIPPGAAESLRTVLDERLIEAARERPTHFCALPQYLLWLGERMRAQGRSLSTLQAVSPYGGLASPRMIDRIEAGFGVPFRNLYGTNELGVMAASCGQSLHVLDDMFVVEIMTDGRPVADGEVGEIVVTDLHNSAMPLIRYRMGDVGRILPGPCACGRHTQRLDVLGRVQEMLETPQGPLPAAIVADAFFQDPGVSNLRVDELAPGRFEASLVANAEGPPPDLAACRDRFAALHGGIRQLTCRTAAYLQPETSGKYKLVVPAQRSVESVR
jgi:phenylacetate-coenzyme A ligase PaaK-like adenylate-forming protein